MSLLPAAPAPPHRPMAALVQGSFACELLEDERIEVFDCGKYLVLVPPEQVVTHPDALREWRARVRRDVERRKAKLD